VTGAAGFIGSHLTNYLVNSGHSVLAVDKFTDYYAVDLKEARVKALLNPLGVNVAYADLEDPNSVDELLHLEDFDSVIHLAAQPGVRLPTKDFGKYIESNITAFSNLLIGVRNREIPNFLYASSSSVYGNCKDSLFSEKNSATEPVSFYGATKLANEILADSRSGGSLTKTRGLRFFTVYGPWGRPDMAYFRLIASVLDEYEFTMFGNGGVLRDFTYIQDVIESIYLLDLNLADQNKGFSDVVNVGGGNPFTLNEMKTTLEGILGVEIKSKLDQRNPNDVTRTCADSEYIQKLIGTHPQTTLLGGLTKVTNWAKINEVSTNLKKWSQSVS